MKWWMVLWMMAVVPWVTLAAEKPAATGPAKDPKQKGGAAMENVKITPEAQEVLAKLTEAYSSIRYVEINGIEELQASPAPGVNTLFRSVFSARVMVHQRFYIEYGPQEHQWQGRRTLSRQRLRFGITDSAAYGFDEKANTYWLVDYHQTKASLEALQKSREAGDLCSLCTKAPGVALFVFADGLSAIVARSRSIDKVDEMTIRFQLGDDLLELTIDPKTHLVTKAMLTQRSVKTITTYEYAEKQKLEGFGTGKGDGSHSF